MNRWPSEREGADSGYGSERAKVYKILDEIGKSTLGIEKTEAATEPYISLKGESELQRKVKWIQRDCIEK